MKLKKFSNTTIAIAALLACLLTATGFYIAHLIQTENRYNFDRNELLKPHNNDDLTSAQIEILFNDLTAIIDTKAGKGTEKNRQLRQEFAGNLIDFFQNSNIDLGKSGNIQLDLKAIKLWKEYPELLASKTQHNLNILHMYSIALSNLSQRVPDFVANARISKKDGGIDYSGKYEPRDGSDKTLFTELNVLYVKHLEFLGKKENEPPADKSKFCDPFRWYIDSTKNKLMAGDVFSLNESELNEMLLICKN